MRHRCEAVRHRHAFAQRLYRWIGVVQAVAPDAVGAQCVAAVERVDRCRWCEEAFSSVGVHDGQRAAGRQVAFFFNRTVARGFTADHWNVIGAGNGDGDILYSGRALTVLYRHSIDFGNALTSRQILRGGIVNGVAPGD